MNPALTIVKARQDQVIKNTVVNNDTENHLNCEESWEVFRNVICNATVHDCFPDNQRVN